jgi:hypothetical protein
VRHKWQVLAVIVGASAALYALGVGALALLPPPWGWVCLFPLAFVVGLACRAVELPRERRARLRYDMRCERCAYDLRATPHRCPECGRTTW